MPALVLPDRNVVHVNGADAGHFLQNLITANIDTLARGEAGSAALLTPQGKILFDFLVSRTGETGFACDIRADQTADFIRRLTLYKLRAAVTFEMRQDLQVVAGWDADVPEGALRDLRFPAEAGVWRLYGREAVSDADRQAWDSLRIAHGVAESGSDFVLSDIFPHDILMDKNGGVDFRKGCYVGQEVVSRMQHRGTARRRVAIVTAQSGGLETGAVVLAGEKPVGVVGTVADNAALAVVRTDRVADALAQDMELTLDGMPVTLALPAWTGLSFNRGDPNTLDD